MDKYEQELFPSINSKNLDFSYENLYRERFNDLYNPSEVYHENSKISLIEKDKVLNGLKKMYNINLWAQSIFNRPKTDDLKQEQQIVFSIDELDQYCNGKLDAIFDNVKIHENTYLCDIFVKVNDSIYLYNAYSNNFVIQIKNIEDANIKKVFLTEQDLKNKLLIFIIARPWRYMRFIGQIGYRKCLLDIGNLTESIISICEKSNLIDIFFDNEVHKILNLDGIESICVRIVSCDLNKN